MIRTKNRAMNKYYFLIILLIFPQLSCSYDVKDDLKVHGFFTQNAIHTSANNMYGNSENSVSTDYTEAGLNVFYSPFDKLSFSSQILYRNAGKVDNDKVEFDYGFMDIRLKEYEQGKYGIRLGRIKNPLGLYNETRDVAFTTPSIILPQGIYYDRSRALLRASDGAQLYLEHRLNGDNISFKLNYGKGRNDNDELLNAVIPYSPPLSPQGDLETSGSSPALLGQVVYERNGGEMVFALSYADVSLEYDPKEFELFANGTTDFELFILSAQYNGEKFNLTGEYLYQNNKFSDFNKFSHVIIFPDSKSTSESWYIQGGYRIKPNWQVYARYDEHYLNKDDKSGKAMDAIDGAFRHMSFSKDTMLGVRWDVNSSVMVRAEYHNLNGTSLLTSADNPDRTKTKRYWDLFALQLSFRF